MPTFSLRPAVRAGLACAAAALLVFFVALAPARAAKMTFTDVGISTKGTPLSVAATIATGTDAWGPTNAVEITLMSYGAPTRHAADVLTSFYFDLVNPLDGTRPSLTYVSGTGAAFAVYTGGGNDQPISWTPQTWTPGSTTPANLVAAMNYDEGWQFKMFTPPPAYSFLSFGIGTVGNSGIETFFPGADCRFDGRVVSGTAPGSMIDLGIYSVGGGTDIDPTRGLDGARLVRTTASFRFLSDTSFAPGRGPQIGSAVAFGFGTSPELFLLPEPGTLPMVASAVIAGLLWHFRRRLRPPRVSWLRRPSSARPGPQDGEQVEDLVDPEHVEQAGGHRRHG